MQKTKAKNFRYYLKWFLWILLAQLVLANVSASIYAYKFTHFYSPPALAFSSQNIFNKTWKLFVGPKFYKNIDEPEPSFSYETIQLKTSDNIPIDAWYSRTDSANTCVLLLHGYSTNKSYVSDAGALFKKWGYSILSIDLRGHGRSGGNATSFGVKETDELEKAFSFAKQKGYSKIIVYGVSLGAAICIKATGEGKIQPNAIIADMPFGNLHHHFKARARIVGFPAEPFGVLTTFWVGVERGFNAFTYNIPSYAKKISCPVLQQWGDQDQYVSKEETESIFNSLGSKNKKLVVYPNVDHDSFLNRDPATWEKEVQAFLESVQ